MAARGEGVVEWSKDRWLYIGQRIRETREGKGLSQDKLAALSDVSAGRISEIELGKRSGTTFETIVDLATAMEADVSTFLYYRSAFACRGLSLSRWPSSMA